MRSADRVRKCLLFGLDRTYEDITKPTRLTHIGLLVESTRSP
jgi:hypothetical protein